MKKSSRRPLLPALRLALAFLVPASGAAAATFQVTTLADSGPGSLRQAVLDANAAPGADEVVFAPGLAGTITLTSNEIVISDPLTVDGPGAGVLTVSGGHQFRIFFVENPAVAAPIDVTLSGLTLTRGRGFPIHLVSYGGAVFANGENLTILDSVISDSTTGFQVDPPPAACGGSVALDGSSDATLRIVNSLLTGGTSLGFGSESGGNLCVLLGRLLLERSTLSGGSADLGGGLLVHSLAEGSSILQSTISGNEADSFGGGIYTEDFETSATLTIDSSTISGNDAFNGGGIANQGSDLQMINSTVSGNQAELGGGIYFVEALDGTLLLRLTTVANNTAVFSGGNLLISGPSAADAVQLDHAIVANGAPEDLAGAGPGPSTLTANFSLIEAPGTTLLVGADNRVGVDPLLGPLAGNGGPTLTHRLLPGSPALDAGNPAIPSPPPTDQRGAARIAGPAVDLGSVEGQGVVVIPTLSHVGLLALCALLLAAGVRRLRPVRVASGRAPSGRR